MAYLLTQETSAVEQNSSSRDGKKEDRKEEVTEVSMKLCLIFVCQDVILWSLSMKDINYNYFFYYKCRSDRVEYAQNFNLLLGRLGKPDTSFQRVISYFLSLAVKSFNFMFHYILKLKNT